MEIVPFQNKYLKECLDIFNYYVENTTISFELTKLSEDEYQNKVNNIIKKYPFYVAKIDDKVVGFCYLDHFNFRKGYDITADLTIYLDKNNLHKGIGKQLVNTIINKAKEMHFENIVSLITDENDNSLNFHKHLGFVEVGYLPNIAIKFNRHLGVKFYLLKI